MSLENRATLGDMSPEYGSTVTMFPVDDETLRYLRFTGRPPELVALVEAYCKEHGDVALVARNAVQRGMSVKTSLAPGSQVVMDYYETAGPLPALEQLGFALVGFGCTTCIGNSGLPPDVAVAVGGLAVASSCPATATSRVDSTPTFA